MSRKNLTTLLVAAAFTLGAVAVVQAGLFDPPPLGGKAKVPALHPAGTIEVLPEVVRQGGNTIEEAIPIEIPGTYNGTTEGYDNNYNEICDPDFPETGAPDVVYSVTPEADVFVDLDLCHSGFDTRLYVYDDAEVLIACNEDAYDIGDPVCMPFSSKLEGLFLQAGRTYYIVIDGWGPAFGLYQLDVTLSLDDPEEAIFSAQPVVAGPFNCAQTATLTYNYIPRTQTPAVRGYEVRLQALGELSIDEDSVTFFVVPPDAQTYTHVVQNDTNDLTLTYAILGETDGIDTAADLFTLAIQGDEPGGTVEVMSVIFRGLDNQIIDVQVGPEATVIYDCTPPAPVFNKAAMPGHEKATVSWLHSGQDVDHFLVFRGLWYTDDPATSAYPLYGRQTPNTIPGRPADVDAALASDEWTLVDVVELGDLSFVDDTMTTGRGVYYYEVFAVDAAGNVSDPAAANARATNYWLGDVNGDGLVSVVDVHALGESFGVCDGHPSFDPFCDVGPTHNMSRLGIPVPDGCVNFEDLMIFAMNFGLVAPLKQQPPGSPVHLAWVHLDDDRYALRLTGGEGLLGLRVRADLPPGLPIAVTAGDLLAQQDGATFLRNVGDGLDVSVAVLGTGRGFTGTGDLFLVSGPLDLAGEDLLLDARGVGNDAIMVSFAQVTGTEVPRAFSLSANFPNPFNPATTIRFALPEAQPVRLAVYGVDGRRVARLVDATYAAGVHEVTWHGTDDRGQLVAAGTYFYRIDAGPYQQVRKMVLVK